MKVKVYKNLTKDTWSIQDYKTRKVIGYSENIRLEDAKFVVSLLILSIAMCFQTRISNRIARRLEDGKRAVAGNTLRRGWVQQ